MRGDIIKVSLGGVVAADARLVSGNVLLDESMLTGESLPIEAGNGKQTFAGALIKRGEAIAEVTATGEHTKFGRSAELISGAHVLSTQQKAVLSVVRNLAIFNGVVVVALLAYSLVLHLSTAEIISLVLTAVLASIPVALRATFTLASAIGTRALAAVGVLPTRLSAVDEAASMDVLCADKTGTLTRNELKVTAIHAMPSFDEAHVLSLGVLDDIALRRGYPKTIVLDNGLEMRSLAMLRWAEDYGVRLHSSSQANQPRTRSSRALMAGFATNASMNTTLSRLSTHDERFPIGETITTVSVLTEASTGKRPRICSAIHDTQANDRLHLSSVA